MNKEVITDPLSPDDLWQDLKSNITQLKTRGISQVGVFYGFSWGSHFYDGMWKEILVSIDELETPLYRAMQAGHGALGHDNFYISVPEFSMKLQYSHETDIHISYMDENELVRIILNRWKDNGWLRYGKNLPQ